MITEFAARKAEVIERLDTLARSATINPLTEEQRSELATLRARLEELDSVEEAAKIVEERRRPTGQTVEVTAQVEERAQEHRQEEEYRSAFESYMRQGVESPLLLERRAQATTPGSAGGFLIPQGFRAKVVETLKAFGGLAGYAEILSTDSGNDLPYPTNDDTANIGAILAENTAVTDLDLTLGQKILKAYKYTSRRVKVSYELLQDSGIAIEPFLGRKLGMRIGRAQAAHWISGTGTGQPEGLLTNKAAAVTLGTGSTGGFLATERGDSLLDTLAALDPAYWPGAAWLMHPATWVKVQKIADGQGRKVVGSGDITQGASPSLWGYPVRLDANMPVFAANAKVIAFGDLEMAYVIRRVNDVAILRLNELYADAYQVGFLGFARADGQVQDPSAYVVMAASAT